MKKQNMQSLLIVLSGPSGVGKDTILKRLVGKRENLYLSISATTRKKRDGEVDGVDYFFTTREDFLKLVDNNGVLEYAEYCGNYYGTPREKVINELNKGNDVILEIETQGGLNVIDENPEVVSIFILPPSFEALRSRLTNRKTDSAEVIEGRLDTAKKEIKRAKRYDYVVINDDIDSCVDDIISIIKVEKMRSYRRGNYIKGAECNE